MSDVDLPFPIRRALFAAAVAMACALALTPAFTLVPRLCFGAAPSARPSP
jgi:hypothetical protein